jgi:type IV secretory pathway VirB4 component
MTQKRQHRTRRRSDNPGRRILDRFRQPGLRLPRHRATTAHAAVLYPFHVDAGLGPAGIYLGDNITAGNSAWCYDPFQLYTDGVLTSPNILVIGTVGSGKSSAVKTLLYRSIGQLGSHGQPRWCAVLDPKGEYGPLAESLGLTRLALRPGGTTHLNPLDPGPGHPSSDELRSRRTQMITALAAAVLRRDLTPTEDATISWAIDTITNHPNTRPPVLGDVIDLLTTPTAEMTAKANADTTKDLAASVADVRYSLARLLDGHLQGMFDGPTSSHIDWQGRGIVIDLSAVHTNPDALTVVMVAAMGWLQTLLADPDRANGPRRIQVWEEIWALLAQHRTARYFQACQKLSRDYGVANISIAHRISDLRAQTDDGTATTKIATGLLADTQTRILFRQTADQIPETTNLLGLTNTEAQLLPRLARGRALWQVVNHKAIVQHRISPNEWPITQTDAQLTI